MTKSKSKPPIPCDKCRKWIKYRYLFGYGHACSGYAKEFHEFSEATLHSINLIPDPAMRNCEKKRFLDSASQVNLLYDPEVTKLLRKDAKMKKTTADLPTPEEVTRIVSTLDLASKLDDAVIAKLSSRKSKDSTPKIGELCGMDLLLDLSGAPEAERYELYFKARTILEEIKNRLEE